MRSKPTCQKRKWVVFFSLLISISIGSATFAKDSPKAFKVVKPETVGLSSDRLGTIDKVLKADVEKGIIAGAALLIARNGKIAYFKSFGMRNKEKAFPMEKDSIFRVYSMTKPVIGVAAAMLIEEGKILLADPVAKYIPAFKDV